MATNSLTKYTEHCKRVEADYKHLHQQHLTVFGAFQRLQQAATGLVKSAKDIQVTLDQSTADDSNIDDTELSRMLDEQETIMNKIRLMEQENEVLMRVGGDKDPDPMYSDDTFTSTSKKKGGHLWNVDDITDRHPRLSNNPPYDGYHESHVAPYKRARGGAGRTLNTSYLTYVQTESKRNQRLASVESFYGYTNALVDIPCLHEHYADAARHNPTLMYPFRRMLSEIVGNVRWCDYVFHHRIPGMFTIEQMTKLSKLKAL